MITTIKKCFSLFILFLSIYSSYAQNDTIYYSENWKVVQQKDSASFYRLPVTKKGDLYLIQDFFISGKKQMKGLSQSPTKEVWQGKVVWFNEDGSIKQEGNYANGYLDGDFVTFLNKNKLVAKYKNGKFISGERNTGYGNSMFYMQKVGDTIREIIYQDDIDGIRQERVGTDKKYELYSKYYGQGGEFLGENQPGSDGYTKGVEVMYVYNPMRVKSTTYYSRGKVLGQTDFYPNGQVRAEFLQEPKLAHVYYTPKGEEMGRVEYKIDNYGILPKEGAVFRFGYGVHKNDYADEYRVERKTVYENGKVQEDATYYENDKLRSLTKYEEGKKTLQISYSEDGAELARMEYENYSPFNGTEIKETGRATYANGKLIKEEVYFPKTEMVQVSKTTEKEVYFDSKGDELGTLTMENSASYPKPWQGKRFRYDYYDGTVSSIEEYEEGAIVQKTSWRKRKISEENSETFKRIEKYDASGFNKINEILFYSNGHKQSDITYRNYKELKGIYYDKDGKIMGEYDFEKKDGARYQFFGDSDEVQEYELTSNGKQLAFKKYDYGNNVSYGSIDPVLVEDFDITCCASYYDREGNLLAEIQFKDEKPWSGDLYDPATKELYQIQKGKKTGYYKKFDYNKNVIAEGFFVYNKKEGVFKTYTYDGIVVSKENYANDHLNGKAFYYNNEGDEIAQMEYKEGKPLNGVRTVSVNYKNEKSLQTYKNGQLIKEEIKTDDTLLVKTYLNEQNVEYKSYYQDSDQVKYQYQMFEGYLSGVVVKFDKNGTELAQANFERGELQNGVVYLNKGYGGQNMSYYSVSKTESELIVNIYGEDNQVLFTSEENLFLGEHTFFTKSLGLELDFFIEKDLF